jgi:hypothetical protein
MSGVQTRWIARQGRCNHNDDKLFVHLFLEFHLTRSQVREDPPRHFPPLACQRKGDLDLLFEGRQGRISRVIRPRSTSCMDGLRSGTRRGQTYDNSARGLVGEGLKQHKSRTSPHGHGRWIAVHIGIVTWMQIVLLSPQYTRRNRGEIRLTKFNRTHPARSISA